jgi:hypothetical protein
MAWEGSRRVREENGSLRMMPSSGDDDVSKFSVEKIGCCALLATASWSSLAVS